MSVDSVGDFCGTLADAHEQLGRSAEEVQEAELHVQSLLRRQAALVHAMRLLQHKHLVATLQQTHMGFQHGRPIAAMVVHRCLLSWRALDVTDTATQALLHSLISVITHALDENQLTKAGAAGGQLSAQSSLEPPTSPEIGEEGGADESSAQRVLALCAYWLTVTSTLLALLHRQIQEHPSYLSANKGLSSQGPQGLAEDVNSSQNSSAATTKLSDFQSKLVSRFSNFRDNLLKRSSASDKPPPEQPPTPPGAAAAAAAGADTGAVLGAALPSAGPFDAAGHDVGAPTPAQVFRHSLDLLLLQAYACVRDAIKKQLTPLLPTCIQAPEALPPAASTHPSETRSPLRTEFEAEAEAVRVGGSDPNIRFTLDGSETDGETAEAGHLDAPAVAAVEEQVVEALKGPPPPGPLHAWEELVAALQAALDQLREQCVPRILIKCVFKQLLGFVDSQLFNQLLLRPDCCCASNARHVLSGLKLLDQWVVSGSADAMMRPLYQELRHVRQAATFLVTPGKAKLSVEDITGSVCPALSAQQIYRLCTTCWDDASCQAMQQQAEAHRHRAPATPRSTPTAAGLEAAAAIMGNGNESADPSVTKSVSALEDDHEEDMVHVPRPETARAAPEHVADLVSGEVLEALKGAGGGVQGNGGLLITFLLDEWQAPIIAPEGCTAREVLNLIDSKELYAPLELPQDLDTPTCPRSVFEFVQEPVALPPHLLAK